MSRIVELIYQDGVFRPTEPVDLPELARLTLSIPEPHDSPTEADVPAWWRGILPVEFSEDIVGQLLIRIPEGEILRLEPEPMLEQRWFEEDDADD